MAVAELAQLADPRRRETPQQGQQRKSHGNQHAIHHAQNQDADDSGRGDILVAIDAPEAEQGERLSA